MRIIQITDSHISIDVPQRAADLQACVQQINEVGPPPDLVIHTGDITHEGLDAEYDIARAQLDQLQTPYAVLAGNKDKRPELCAAFGDNQYLNKSDVRGEGTALVDGFIQFSIESFPVRVIVLDTLGSGSKGELGEKRLQHLHAMLQADTTRPAVVFMHHTPFEAHEIPDPFQFEDWADVEKLVVVFGQSKQLRSVYCGHVHRNVDAMLDNLPVSALTCLACDLRKGQMSEADRLRPMFKIIDLSHV